MARVHIMPGYETIFRERGWDAAAPFLAWTGILVNRHRDRQVESVTLDGASFYLKKQFAVSWNDRFRNAWAGFGWCSMAAREAKVLIALRKNGIGCADVVAFGEQGRQAFLLLTDQANMTELRVYLQQRGGAEERCRLADALGAELARLHDAGFEHPDLFAKHILAAREAGAYRFCILDWQRGRRHRHVSWRRRCRDLAALDATLHDALASDRLRLRCLAAYRRACKPRATRPPLRRLALRIRHEATSYGQRRTTREIRQLPVPATQQQFVALCEGRLLVVRSCFEELEGRLPDWLMRWPESGHLGSEAYRMGEPYRIRMSDAPAASTLPWPLPPPAHVLFRLQRFGVPAPRLFAAARSSSQELLVTIQEPSLPFAEVLATAPARPRIRLIEQSAWIIRQIHEAGYRLAAAADWERRLGVIPATGDVVLVDAESLESIKTRKRQDGRRWERQAVP